KLNIEKLLELKQTDEAAAFRQLFFSNENLDIEELVKKSETKLEKLKNFVDSTGSKTIRFAIGTALGGISGAWSLISGITDFATGMTIKSEPVTCFLNNQLPSIFQNASEQVD
ncbi:MAG TPA: hypothetical protein VJ873_02840, partial [bacterium]|nr:hypothetical protein [bacterium]